MARALKRSAREIAKARRISSLPTGRPAPRTLLERRRARLGRGALLRGTSALTAAGLLAGGIAGWAGYALALPEGATVVEGEAQIVETAPGTIEIHQISDQVIIEWQNFDILAGESVTFIQPSDLAAALNRVLGGEITSIMGSLTSNGQIVITNPAGITFGPDADVKVASIIASTLGITNANFMGGRMIFDQLGDPRAVVSNQGRITAADGGLAALVAPGVQNSGVIVAKLGTVALAAGNAVTLDFYGDGLVQIAIHQPVREVPLGVDGQPVTSLVDQQGGIYADGGTVVLTASAAEGVLDRVINVGGVTQAQTIEDNEGQIALVGGAHGEVQVAGTVDATGTDAGEKGGTVHVLGDVVHLADGASVDVSGDAGGGTVLVGGDYLGGTHQRSSGLAYLDVSADEEGGLSIVLDEIVESHGYIPRSEVTYIAVGATVAANAVTDGDGGKVIAWGDEATYFGGAIYARAGVDGGNGGFVETSAPFLIAEGYVRADAPRGAAGTWLLDPRTIEVNATDTPSEYSVSGTNPIAILAIAGTTSNVGVAVVKTALDAGTSVTLKTNNNAGASTDVESGDIIINAAISKTAGGDATFRAEAHDDVIVNAGISSTSGKLTVELLAGFVDGANTDDVNDVVVGAAISTNGGDFLAQADHDINSNSGTAGTITTAGGKVTMNALAPAGVNESNILYNAAISTGGGALAMTAGDDIRIAGAITTGGGHATFTTLGQNAIADDRSDVQFTGSTGSVSTANASGAEGNITIIAEELILQAVAGAQLNAAQGSTSDDGIILINRPGLGAISIGAGAAAVSDTNMQITQVELARISGAQLQIGGNAGNNVNLIAVNGANTTTATISGLVTLNALGGTAVADVTFAGANVFSSMTANADDDITLIDSGSITITGGVSAIAGLSAFDDVVLQANTLITTNGGSVSLQTNALVSADSLVSIDGDVTTNGGRFAAQADSFVIDDDGDTVSTSGGKLEILADAIEIDDTNAAVAELTAGTGDIYIYRVTAGTVGLGSASGGLQLSQGELNSIDAARLTIGDPDAFADGTISGDNLTPHVNQITDIFVANANFADTGGTDQGIDTLVRLFALNAGSGADIDFDGNNVFPALLTVADDQIRVNASGNAAATIETTVGGVSLTGNESFNLPGVLVNGVVDAQTTFFADAAQVNLGADIITGTADGISGTATTVNILSTSAQIQDGVDVAATTPPGTTPTLDIAAGTYNQAFTVDKPLNVDATGATINGNTPALTVTANSTFTGGTYAAGGTATAAIVVASTVTSVSFTGVTVGGGTTTDGIFVDNASNLAFTFAGGSIGVGANDIDADGIDFDKALGTGADIKITDSTIDAADSNTAIQFDEAISGNAKILIGGLNDGNTITAADHGIEFQGAVSGTANIEISHNDVTAADDGARFGSTVSGAAVIKILANNAGFVTGGHGISFIGAVSGADIDIHDNLIESNTNNDSVGAGIFFGSTVADSTIDIGDGSFSSNPSNVITVNGTGGDDSALDGIRFVGTIDADTDVTIDGNWIGFRAPSGIGAGSGTFTNARVADDAIQFVAAVSADVTIVDNHLRADGAGVRFDGMLGDRADIIIGRVNDPNQINANEQGITFNGAVTGTAFISIGFNEIDADLDGVRFGSTVSNDGNDDDDDDIVIEFNDIAAAIDSGTGHGISFVGAVSNGGHDTRIRDNIHITSADSDGINYGSTVTDADIRITGNDDITGADDGVDFEAVVSGAHIVISGNNDGIVGEVNSGIEFSANVTNTELDILSNIITAGADAILFEGVIDGDSDVDIGDNTMEGGDGSSAIGSRGVEIQGGIEDTAYVKIHDNEIDADDDGILVNGSGVTDEATLEITENLIGTYDEPVGEHPDETDFPSGGGNGIDIQAVDEDGTVWITKNKIYAEDHGVQFDENDGNSVSDDADVDIHDNIIKANLDNHQIGSGIWFEGDIRGDADVRIGDGLGAEGGHSNIIFVGYNSLTDDDRFLDGIHFHGQVDLDDDGEVDIDGNRIGFWAHCLTCTLHPDAVPDDGIEFREEVDGESHVTIRDNWIKAKDDGVRFRGEVHDDAVVLIGGEGDGNIIKAGDEGVEFSDDIYGDAHITIAENWIGYYWDSGEDTHAEAAVGGNGIEFGDDISEEAKIDILKNHVRAEEDGILFAGTTSNHGHGEEDIRIDRNSIVGGKNGINFAELVFDDRHDILITDNFWIQGKHRDGIRFGEGVAEAEVRIDENWTIKGKDEGIDFRDLVWRGANIYITNNKKIEGEYGDGTAFNGVWGGDTDVLIDDNDEIEGGDNGIAFYLGEFPEKKDGKGGEGKEMLAWSLSDDGGDLWWAIDEAEVVISDNDEIEGHDENGIFVHGVRGDGKFHHDDWNLKIVDNGGYKHWEGIFGEENGIYIKQFVYFSQVECGHCGYLSADSVHGWAIENAKVKIDGNSRIDGDDKNGIWVEGIHAVDDGGWYGWGGPEASLKIDDNGKITGQKNGIYLSRGFDLISLDHLGPKDWWLIHSALDDTDFTHDLLKTLIYTFGENSAILSAWAIKNAEVEITDNKLIEGEWKNGILVEGIKSALWDEWCDIIEAQLGESFLLASESGSGHHQWGGQASLEISGNGWGGHGGHHGGDGDGDGDSDSEMFSSGDGDGDGDWGHDRGIIGGDNGIYLARGLDLLLAAGAEFDGGLETGEFDPVRLPVGEETTIPYYWQTSDLFFNATVGAWAIDGATVEIDHNKLIKGRHDNGILVEGVRDDPAICCVEIGEPESEGIAALGGHHGKKNDWNLRISDNKAIIGKDNGIHLAWGADASFTIGAVTYEEDLAVFYEGEGYAPGDLTYFDSYGYIEAQLSLWAINAGTVKIDDNHLILGKHDDGIRVDGVTDGDPETRCCVVAEPDHLVIKDNKAILGEDNGISIRRGIDAFAGVEFDIDIDIDDSSLSSGLSSIAFDEGEPGLGLGLLELLGSIDGGRLFVDAYAIDSAHVVIKDNWKIIGEDDNGILVEGVREHAPVCCEIDDPETETSSLHGFGHGWNLDIKDNFVIRGGTDGILLDRGFALGLTDGFTDFDGPGEGGFVPSFFVFARAWAVDNGSVRIARNFSIEGETLHGVEVRGVYGTPKGLPDGTQALTDPVDDATGTDPLPDNGDPLVYTGEDGELLPNLLIERNFKITGGPAVAPDPESETPGSAGGDGIHFGAGGSLSVSTLPEDAFSLIFAVALSDFSQLDPESTSFDPAAFLSNIETFVDGDEFLAELFVGSVQGGSVIIDKNGAAFYDGGFYTASDAVIDLGLFDPIGTIRGGDDGIDFAGAIFGGAGVRISRNIIGGDLEAGSGDNGIVFSEIGAGTLPPAEGSDEFNCFCLDGCPTTVTVLNNFILNNGASIGEEGVAGDGIRFAGFIDTDDELANLVDVKIFQNFIAGNGGDGVEATSDVGEGAENIEITQNYIPAGSTDDVLPNGAFGVLNGAGNGTIVADYNWWGTADPVTGPDMFALGLIAGPVEVNFILEGPEDSNNELNAGRTVFDDFAFQGGAFRALIHPVTDIDFDQGDLRFQPPGLGVDPTGPGYAQYYTSNNPYLIGVFVSDAGGFTYAFGSTAPAAGGDLSPAAGGEGSPAAGEDPNNCAAAFMGGQDYGNSEACSGEGPPAP